MKRFFEQLTDWMLEWAMALIGPAIAVLFIATVGIGILIVYQISTSAASEMMFLKKAEWECRATKTETRTYYVYVGKVMIPQTVTSDVCVEWRRR